MTTPSTTSTPAPAPPSFAHSGFFVMRTPLLPLEMLQTWAGAAQNAASPEIPESHGDDLDEARARLRALFDTPDLRDALFIASPAVEEALRRDGATKDEAKRDRLDASLTKYLMRMAGR